MSLKAGLCRNLEKSAVFRRFAAYHVREEGQPATFEKNQSICDIRMGKFFQECANRMEKISGSCAARLRVMMRHPL
jgi:hypothetical protein